MTPRREPRLHAFAGTPEPPAEPAAPVARTVSEVVAGVNRILERDPDCRDIWIKGEVSSFASPGSGHWYFQLKDAQANLACVVWRSTNIRFKFRPDEGMEVLVRGRLTAYAARSQLQLTVDEVRAVGAGDLAAAFEQLKRRLTTEGLFDPAAKRDLPEHPTTVGIVTSRNAAALRDIVHVAVARNPAIRLLVADARVQGIGAAEEITHAIARLDGKCDVIIVARGGGSLEDLWAFNEETVVRAIAACRTPIVSGVGHETDTTLADYAADIRAATPSAAAECVVPDAEALQQMLADGEERMQAALARLVPQTRQRLDDLLARAEGAIRRTVKREADMLQARAASLHALSPLAVLGRGYTVTRREGRVVRTASDIAIGDEIEIILPDGRVDATVKDRHEGSYEAEE